MTKNYYIRINKGLVPVTEEIYREYHRMNRRERYLEERDIIHGKVLYSEMDTLEMTGEDAIPDMGAASVEDSAIKSILIERLRKCFDLLSGDEYELIKAMFFSNDGDGMSEREYAALLGLSKTAIHARKEAVFAKLKKFLDK